MLLICRQPGNPTAFRNPANFGSPRLSLWQRPSIAICVGLKAPGEKPRRAESMAGPRQLQIGCKLWKITSPGPSVLPGGPLTLLNVGRRINLSDFWRCPGYSVTGNTSFVKRPRPPPPPRPSIFYFIFSLLV